MQRKLKTRAMTSGCPVFILVALVCTGSVVNAAEPEESDKSTDSYSSKTAMSPDAPNTDGKIPVPDGMAHAMEDFLIAAEQARKLAHEGVLPQEEIDKHYAKMAQMLEEILDYMYSVDNAYAFLQAKGLETIISPNMHIPFTQLRNPMLQLIKALFEIAPTTTVTIIPNNILDKLVDIFERDEDLGIKTLAIEVLSDWLPGHPKAQARVMKIKGLQPFYKQLSKLETPVTKITLELFNKILNEHAVARNSKAQKNKADYKTLQLYQQIGLIERLSTSMMCNGLMNIFVDIFSFDKPDKDMLPPVLRLLQFIKPYCSKVYQGKAKAASLIDQMLTQVQEPTNRLHLEKMQVNVTSVIEELTEFAEVVSQQTHSEL